MPPCRLPLERAKEGGEGVGEEGEGEEEEKAAPAGVPPLPDDARGEVGGVGERAQPHPPTGDRPAEAAAAAAARAAVSARALSRRVQRVKDAPRQR